MDLPHVVGLEQEQEVLEQGLQRDGGFVDEFGPGARAGDGRVSA